MRLVKRKASRTSPNLLNPVFGFGLGFGLPLHIARGIRAAPLQWGFVINHVTGASTTCPAGRRARVASLELMLRDGAARNPALAVAGA